MSTLLVAIVAALIAAASANTIASCGGTGTSGTLDMKKSTMSASGTSESSITVSYSLAFTAPSIAGAKVSMASWKIAAFPDPSVDLCMFYIPRIAPCSVAGSVQTSGNEYVATGTHVLTAATVGQLPGFVTSFGGNNTVQIVVSNGSQQVLCASLTFSLASWKHRSMDGDSQWK